jgi:hypothetical protein
VRLMIDDELVDSTTVPSGPLHEIELIVPAERIHTEPFVRVRIEHGYSGIAGTDPRERSLAYFWIEWLPRPFSCSLTFSTGWYGLEGSGQDWWRWTDGRGQVRVLVEKDTDAVIRGGLCSIQQPNEVDILLNGEKLITLDITWDGFGGLSEPLPLHLEAGENVLEFVSHNPAITTPTDGRPLAIAVKNLSLTIGADDATTCEVYITDGL